VRSVELFSTNWRLKKPRSSDTLEAGQDLGSDGETNGIFRESVGRVDSLGDAIETGEGFDVTIGQELIVQREEAATEGGPCQLLE